jgi:hypothetical protein
MKYLLVPALMLVLLCSMAFSAGSMYNKGEKVGFLGIGLGGLGGFYGSADLPVIMVGLDYGVHKDVSIGGAVGYTSSSNEFLGGKWKYTYITIAARGSYHFPLDVENVDVYGGVDLGYNIVSSKFDGPAVTGFGNVSASGSYLLWGIHAGGRYYFTRNIAAFGELGYGFGIFNVGIAVKF